MIPFIHPAFMPRRTEHMSKGQALFTLWIYDALFYVMGYLFTGAAIADKSWVEFALGIVFLTGGVTFTILTAVSHMDNI